MQAEGDGPTQVTPTGDREGQAAVATSIGRSTALIALGSVTVLVLIAGAIYLFVSAAPGEKPATQASSDATASAPTSQSPEPQRQAQSAAPSATAAAQAPGPPASAAPEAAARPRQTQTAPISQEPAALPRADMKVVQATRANLRVAPRRRARVIGTVARGSEVKIVRSSGRWVEVETGGRTGWVNGKLLGSRASAQ